MANKILSKFQLNHLYNLEYPTTAPIVTFSPTISHPNVFDSGQVVLEILDSWKKHFTLQDIIQEVYDLLKCPNVNSNQPSNMISTFNYLQDGNVYEDRARRESIIFAPDKKRDVTI